MPAHRTTIRRYLVAALLAVPAGFAIGGVIGFGLGTTRPWRWGDALGFGLNLGYGGAMVAAIGTVGATAGVLAVARRGRRARPLAATIGAPAAIMIAAIVISLVQGWPLYTIALPFAFVAAVLAGIAALIAEREREPPTERPQQTR